MNNTNDIDNRWLNKDENLLTVEESNSVTSLKKGNEEDIEISGPPFSRFGKKNAENIFGSRCRIAALIITIFLLLVIGSFIVTFIINEKGKFRAFRKENIAPILAF